MRLTRFAQEILRDRPFAYWPMQEVYGVSSSPPVEALGRYTLGVVGSMYYGNAFLAPGESRFMEQNAGYLTGPSGAPFTAHAGANGKMSFEMLVRPWALANGTMLMTKGQGGNYEYSLTLSANGAFTWDVHILSGASSAGSAAAPAGSLIVQQPALIGGIYDKAGSLVAVYKNGSEVGRSTSLPGTSGAGNSVFMLFERQDGGGDPYNGAMGHVSVYDYVLSPSRFAAHYRALQPPPLRRI